MTPLDFLPPSAGCMLQIFLTSPRSTACETMPNYDPTPMERRDAAVNTPEAAQR